MNVSIKVEIKQQIIDNNKIVNKMKQRSTLPHSKLSSSTKTSCSQISKAMIVTNMLLVKNPIHLRGVNMLYVNI